MLQPAPLDAQQPLWANDAAAAAPPPTTTATAVAPGDPPPATLGRLRWDDRNNHSLTACDPWATSKPQNGAENGGGDRGSGEK